MTAPGVPTGRTLAAWWRQLAPHQPRRLWFADWCVHRVEVTARCSRPVPLDPLDRQLLDLLHLSPADTAAVAARLGLAVPLVHRLLAELADLGLARGTTPTDAGRAALANGQAPRVTFERRIFCLRAAPPAFLPLTGEVAKQTAEAGAPPLDELRACAARPQTWKHRVGFPEEVDAIPDSPPWRNVAIDRPERVMLALIQTPTGEVRGFTARPERWSLSATPVLTLADGGGEYLGLPEPSADAWRLAWREWCATTRAMSPSAADAATLTRSEHRLVVSGPDVRPALFDDDAWLLAGDATCSAAARLTASVEA